MTAAMQDGLAGIIKAYKNNKALSLFASDVRLNIKLNRFYPAATAGECTPVIYDHAETASAFFDVLARTVLNGHDMTYQPQMIATGGLQGSKVLLVTRNEIKDENNIVVERISDSMLFGTVLFVVETAIKKTGAKFVFIDDIVEFAREDCKQILAELGELARLLDVIMLAGFMLKEDEEGISGHLATHAHNLWQLTTKSLKMGNETEPERDQRYFCFGYGLPDPKRVYYGIGEDGHICTDEKGKICLPQDLVKLLRIKELAFIHAKKWIAQNKFINICIGATDGEFEGGSFATAIQVAAENGIIKKSGQGNYTKLLYAEGTMKQTSYNGNIALTALGKPYSVSKKCHRQRKAILKHGEFRLLVPRRGTKGEIMQYFLIKLMANIVTGQKWLDFNIKTSHRNSLAIIISSPNKSISILENFIETYGDNKTVFEKMELSEGIADTDFLETYKTAIDEKKPDFVFIFCFNRIKQRDYTDTQLAKELAFYSRKKGVCTIAESDTESDTEKDRFAVELGDNCWSISPLVKDEDRAELLEDYNIVLPNFFSFQGSVGDFDFLCRFEYIGKGLFNAADSKELKWAFLIGTFYSCNGIDCNTLEEDCTGEPLTNQTIFQASQMKRFFKVVRYGKKYRNSIITFIYDKI